MTFYTTKTRHLLTIGYVTLKNAERFRLLRSLASEARLCNSWNSARKIAAGKLVFIRQITNYFRGRSYSSIMERFHV